MKITPDTLLAAVARHETIFLNADLEPVVPQAGQWFVELSIELADEGNEIVYEGELVEFVETTDVLVGNGIVRCSFVSSGDGSRRPFGDALILQA